jgi:hypothetical protein
MMIGETVTLNSLLFDKNSLVWSEGKKKKLGQSERGLYAPSIE